MVMVLLLLDFSKCVAMTAAWIFFLFFVFLFALIPPRWDLRVFGFGLLHLGLLMVCLAA